MALPTRVRDRVVAGLRRLLPIVEQQRAPQELWRRELFGLGLKLLRRVLDDLSLGVLVRISQEPAVATWEPAMDRPPLFRPELPQLGEIAGFRTVRSAEVAARTFSEIARSAHPSNAAGAAVEAGQGCAPVPSAPPAPLAVPTISVGPRSS